MHPISTLPQCAPPQSTSNLRIVRLEPLVPPARLAALLPIDTAATDTIVAGRQAVERVLSGDDPRLLVVIGPCSIHDPDAARDYAAKLLELSHKVADRLLVVMRVYFEKPRTTVGWKGLINDPHLDGSFDVATGLRLARGLLIEIAQLGLSTATEFLEPITPQYIADTIVLGAIGARTTESPTHRQMASGLSMPVGFKNSTDGSLQAAVDAMQAARTPHSFLGIDNEGGTCVVSTTGNPWGVLMLRGGRSGSNYSPDILHEARQLLEKAGLPTRMIVDCSHANSGKDHTRQSIVWRDVLAQRVLGDRSIVGMMLESNIHAGSQPVQSDRSKLAYGVSVTDGCIGWDETESLMIEAHSQLK
ncbi:MAG: 3-deoxy-7-phosphoheptulonate synthase [Planctomycetota bacterium]|nr:MAG: 3-deoxy-7-phosphoheptulonate synthase [Planctomycetota bacterium]